ncbi:hypothetical protein HDU93_008454 [Gonapodya sp. JEL0774]|nr:hypothetical protein HDU93_008454 [Gonapodya sp. JEL0774]
MDSANPAPSSRRVSVSSSSSSSSGQIASSSRLQSTLAPIVPPRPSPMVLDEALRNHDKRRRVSLTGSTGSLDDVETETGDGSGSGSVSGRRLHARVASTSSSAAQSPASSPASSPRLGASSSAASASKGFPTKGDNGSSVASSPSRSIRSFPPSLPASLSSVSGALPSSPTNPQILLGHRRTSRSSSSRGSKKRASIDSMSSSLPSSSPLQADTSSSWTSENEVTIRPADALKLRMEAARIAHQSDSEHDHEHESEGEEQGRKNIAALASLWQTKGGAGALMSGAVNGSRSGSGLALADLFKQAVPVTPVTQVAGRDVEDEFLQHMISGGVARERDAETQSNTESQLESGYGISTTDERTASGSTASTAKGVVVAAPLVGHVGSAETEAVDTEPGDTPIGAEWRGDASMSISREYHHDEEDHRATAGRPGRFVSTDSTSSSVNGGAIPGAWRDDQDQDSERVWLPASPQNPQRAEPEPTVDLPSSPQYAKGDTVIRRPSTAPGLPREWTPLGAPQVPALLPGPEPGAMSFTRSRSAGSTASIVTSPMGDTAVDLTPRFSSPTSPLKPSMSILAASSIPHHPSPLRSPLPHAIVTSSPALYQPDPLRHAHTTGLGHTTSGHHSHHHHHHNHHIQVHPSHPAPPTTPGTPPVSPRTHRSSGGSESPARRNAGPMWSGLQTVTPARAHRPTPDDGIAKVLGIVVPADVGTHHHHSPQHSSSGGPVSAAVGISASGAGVNRSRSPSVAKSLLSTSVSAARVLPGGLDGVVPMHSRTSSTASLSKAPGVFVLDRRSSATSITSSGKHLSPPAPPSEHNNDDDDDDDDDDDEDEDDEEGGNGRRRRRKRVSSDDDDSDEDDDEEDDEDEDEPDPGESADDPTGAALRPGADVVMNILSPGHSPRSRRVSKASSTQDRSRDPSWEADAARRTVASSIGSTSSILSNTSRRSTVSVASGVSAVSGVSMESNKDGSKKVGRICDQYCL